MSTWINCFAMDVTRMTRLAHWKFYTMAEKYPEYMDRYSIAMERLKMAIPWNASWIWNEDSIWLDRSELLCHQVLLKDERHRESCWHRLAAGWGWGGSKRTPCWSLARCYTATSILLRKERQCLRAWHQAPSPTTCIEITWAAGESSQAKKWLIWILKKGRFPGKYIISLT